MLSTRAWAYVRATPTPSWMSVTSKAPGRGRADVWWKQWQARSWPSALWSTGSCGSGTLGDASPGMAAGQMSGRTGQGTCAVSSCRMAAVRASSGWSTATSSGTWRLQAVGVVSAPGPALCSSRLHLGSPDLAAPLVPACGVLPRGAHLYLPESSSAQGQWAVGGTWTARAQPSGIRLETRCPLVVSMGNSQDQGFPDTGQEMPRVSWARQWTGHRKYLCLS